MPVFGYTVNDVTGAVYRFQVDGTSTTATLVNDLTDDGYTGNGDDVEGLATLNSASNTACNVIGISESDNGAAVDPHFVRLNRTNQDAFAFDTPVGSGDRIPNEAGLAVRQSDQAVFNLQAVDVAPGPRSQLYRINSTTGAATRLGPLRNGQYADGLAITSNGIAYASDGQLTNSLFRVNLTNGAFTRVGSFGVTLSQDTGLDAIRVGTQDQVYLLAERGGLYRVNTTNGRLTFLKTINLPNRTTQDYEGLGLTLSASCAPTAAAEGNLFAQQVNPDMAATGLLLLVAAMSSVGLLMKKFF